MLYSAWDREINISFFFATFLYENEAPGIEQAVVVTMATRVLPPLQRTFFSKNYCREGFRMRVWNNAVVPLWITLDYFFVINCSLNGCSFLMSHIKNHALTTLFFSNYICPNSFVKCLGVMCLIKTTYRNPRSSIEGTLLFCR